MTTLPDIYIEMDVYSALTDPDGSVINDPDSVPIDVLGGWGDVTEDVRQSVPVTYTSGNPGHSIEDRVADEGILTLAFDNSGANSAGLAGYYSPDSGNVREGFSQDAPIRVRMVSGTVTYYQWQGVISTIHPESGIYGSRLTMVEAVDYMHYLMETDFTGVSVQSGKRDDELLGTLIAQVPAPQAVNYDTGDDTYTYAFHDEITGTSRIATVIQKMMMSGLGKLYVRGGTATAETLRYITRSSALLTASPVATLDNTMQELEVIRDDTSRVKKVIVTTYPAQIDTSDVVLWQLNNEILLTAGQSLTFTMTLRDPSGRATRVAALSTVAPVANTDFKFSSVSGSGNDLNGNITFSYAAGADAIDVTIHNTAGVTGYLWFFQPRGRAIYLYEPTTVSQTTGMTVGHNLYINMVYQDDVLVGTDIANVVASWYAVPVSNISSVRFLANSSDDLMTAALTVQPGDYVVIKEVQTGINMGFFVNGITKEIRLGGKIIYVTWNLAPANQLENVFILDVSALDVDRLGA